MPEAEHRRLFAVNLGCKRKRRVDCHACVDREGQQNNLETHAAGSLSYPGGMRLYNEALDADSSALHQTCLKVMDR